MVVCFVLFFVCVYLRLRISSHPKSIAGVPFDSVRRFRASLLLRTTCIHLCRNWVASCVAACGYAGMTVALLRDCNWLCQLRNNVSLQIRRVYLALEVFALYTLFYRAFRKIHRENKLFVILIYIMMMIAFITIKSSLVLLIEGLCA